MKFPPMQFETLFNKKTLPLPPKNKLLKSLRINKSLRGSWRRGRRSRPIIATRDRRVSPGGVITLPLRIKPRPIIPPALSLITYVPRTIRPTNHGLSTAINACDITLVWQRLDQRQTSILSDSGVCFGVMCVNGRSKNPARSCPKCRRNTHQHQPTK